MSQHERVHVSARRKGPCLSRGQVTVLLCERGVVVAEGGLRHEQIHTLCKLLSACTRRSVHHEGEALAGPPHAHILQSYRSQPSLALQPADVGAGNSGGGEPVRQERDAVRLNQPVAVSLDPVGQRPHLQTRRHQGASAVRVQPQIKTWGGEGNEGTDDVFAGNGKVQVDGVPNAVEDHSRKDPGQTEAVVAMNMRKANAGDLSGRNACENHLPLRAFPGIKEQTLTVPQQQIAVVVSRPGGDLGGRAQDDEFTHETECATPAANCVVIKVTAGMHAGTQESPRNPLDSGGFSLVRGGGLEPPPPFED